MADKTVQPNSPTLVRASARNLRVSPRKMRLVTNLIKNMQVGRAVTQLQFTNQKAARMLEKVVRSGIANAENNFSLNAEDLYVKEATCDMGLTMKRFMPRARGSAAMIRRKSSHVNLILENRPNKKKKNTAVPTKKTTKKIDNSDKVSKDTANPSVKKSAVRSEVNSKTSPAKPTVKKVIRKTQGK